MTVRTYIFTGTSGLKKRDVLRRFRKYFLTEYSPNSDLIGLDALTFEQRAQAIIPIIELCGLSNPDLEGDLYRLYEAYNEAYDEFRAAVTQLMASGTAKYIFVHTHLAHFILGHYRSWLAIRKYDNVFEELGIDIRYVINLIDNIYTCRANIREGGYPYTLDQIITWRDIEHMMTEILSGRLVKGPSIYNRSKVVAVNHCVRTLADLITDANPQLYLAYPISKLRNAARISKLYPETPINELVYKPAISEQDKNFLLSLSGEFTDSTLEDAHRQLATQVDEFRRFFSARFVAYDPGTIDEMPLIYRADAAKEESGEEFSVSLDDFFSEICPPALRLSGGDILSERELLPIPKKEVEELRVSPQSGDYRHSTSIQRQVRSRDFRLIEQSQALIAYRPTLGGRWSRGMYEEILHVSHHLHKPFFIIKDKKDSILQEESTLGRGWGPEHLIERDLSKVEYRLQAFEEAAKILTSQVENVKKNVIT
jgi:hypothetical protein